ncbi:MAG: hypothetical protein V4515_04265 [Chloroflexota bacterium]
MTRRHHEHPNRAWPGTRRAMLLMLSAILAWTVAGCSGGGTTPGTTYRPPTSTPAVVVEATPSPSPATASVVLAGALAPLDAASDFDSSVSIDGVVSASIAGRSVGSSTQMTVTSAGRTVEYLRVPPTAWAREPGGTWLVVAGAEAPASPLSVLATPATLAFAEDGVTLVATYPAAALGLAGEPVQVTITIDGTTVVFRYETKISERTVVSTTTVRPAASSEPIATPAP